MSDADYQKILTDIALVKQEIQSLDRKVNELEKDIREDFQHRIDKTEWEHQNYDRRISFTEKILFGAVGIILITVLGALLATVIVK